MSEALNRLLAEKARRQQAAQPESKRVRGPQPNQPGYMPTQGAPMVADPALSLGSGLVRGATALADLPGQAFNAVGGGIANLASRAGIVSPETARLATEQLAFGPLGSGSTAGQAADVVLPGARNYQPRSTLGEYAQTVGEFLPAAALAGAPVAGGVVPALASEAAGQATEGTKIEPYARLIGAVAAPVALNIGTRKFQNLFNATAEKPTIDGLRRVKSAAYDAVDEAGEVFTPQETSGLLGRVKTALDDGNYVPGVDRQTDAVVALLEKRSGQPLKLGQLDKIRQSLFKRYDAAPNEIGILDAIDEIDTLIASRSDTNSLMQAARLANSRYKKAELLDIAFRKAADQTASTGSGGNILNKYRQAVTSIINNQKQAKWFSPEEIETMRAFVRGDVAENVLRRIGKLSPGGNGLMLALNLGATAIEPTMLGVTAVAAGSKAAADSMATRKAMQLMDTMAGVPPVARQSSGAANVLAPAVSALVNR